MRASEGLDVRMVTSNLAHQSSRETAFPASKNLFINHTQADRAWGELIAWNLGAAGYGYIIQGVKRDPGW